MWKKRDGSLVLLCLDVVLVSAGRIGCLSAQEEARGSLAFIWLGLQITFGMTQIYQMYRVEWVKVPNIECGAERSHGGGGRAVFENWILFSVIITGGSPAPSAPTRSRSQPLHTD